MTSTMAPNGAATLSNVYRYQKIRFWHFEGMVAMADERTGKEKLLTPFEGTMRAAAFARDAERMHHMGWKYRDEMQACLKAAANMKTVVKEAIAYGCPMDPEVARRDAEQRRQVTMYMGGVSAQRKDRKLYVPGESE